MFFCYTYVVPINGLAPFRVLCRSMVEHPNGKSECWMIDSLNWKFRSFLCLALGWHHFPRLASWGARQTWGGGGEREEVEEGDFFLLHVWYTWANIVTTPSQYGHVWTIGERNQLKRAATAQKYKIWHRFKHFLSMNNLTDITHTEICFRLRSSDVFGQN